MGKRSKEERSDWWERYSEDKRSRIEGNIEKAEKKGKKKKARKLKRKLRRKEEKWKSKIERGAKVATKRSIPQKAARGFGYMDPIGKWVGTHKILGFKDGSQTKQWDKPGFMEDPRYLDGEGGGGAFADGSLYDQDQFAQTQNLNRS